MKGPGNKTVTVNEVEALFGLFLTLCKVSTALVTHTPLYFKFIRLFLFFHQRVTISKDDTLILDGADDKKVIEERCKQVVDSCMCQERLGECQYYKY